MRWRPGRRSRNLEDRRARTGRARGPLRLPFPGRARGPGRVRLPLPGGRAPRLSLGSVAVLLLVLWLFGGDLLGGPSTSEVEVGLPGFPGAGSVSSGGPVGSPAEERLVDFVSFVLDDAQATWARLLPGYRDARLVLYRDSVRSGCGFGSAQMGPFYCPEDEKVYIDLGFYEELSRRFGAPGDFAQAYVLAHELGHHVQKVKGIEPAVRRAQRQDRGLANELSVRMELQADCLAGVWGHSTAQRELLERGDVEEGLRAAAAIGDDAIQRSTTGSVRPETFTHGTSRQRVEWFRRGLESGDPAACDTFEARLR